MIIGIFHTFVEKEWELNHTAQIFLGSYSGEGGIRTRVPLRETRSPGVRVRPDYATSPN